MKCSRCGKYSGHITGYLNLSSHLCEECDNEWKVFSKDTLKDKMQQFIVTKKKSKKSLIKLIKDWMNEPNE